MTLENSRNFFSYFVATHPAWYSRQMAQNSLIKNILTDQHKVIMVKFANEHSGS